MGESHRVCHNKRTYSVIARSDKALISDSVNIYVMCVIYLIYFYKSDSYKMTLSIIVKIRCRQRWKKDFRETVRIHYTLHNTGRFLHERMGSLVLTFFCACQHNNIKQVAGSMSSAGRGAKLES